MTVKEQIDFWNSLPEEEQNKEVTVCGLTVEEVMKRNMPGFVVIYLMGKNMFQA